jgi:acyl carrier protein
VTPTVLQQIQQIAADVFSVPRAQITAESSPETVESWDSVQHLNLVLALEEQFHLQFEPEEMERMHTVGQIAALVEDKHKTA